MGVEVDLYVHAGSRTVPSRQDYRDLIAGLLREGWVVPPYQVLTGTTDSDWSAAGILNSADPGSRKMRILYTGNDGEALLRAWDEAPFGRKNVFVSFHALRADHSELRAFFERQACSSGEAILSALAKPVRVEIWNEEDEKLIELRLRHYFGVSGKNGPSTLRGSPLENRLAKCLGGKLVEVCEFA